MTKAEVTTKALEHHQKMLEKYPNINDTITTLKLDSTTVKPLITKYASVPTLKFANETTMGLANRLVRNSYVSVGVLNFASYTNPGGGFLTGATTQEESICMETPLYEILSAQSDFYDYNNKNKHNGLYEHRALYSVDVPYLTGQIDILTCAAPNRSAFPSDQPNLEVSNKEVVKERIRFILQCFDQELVHSIIVGAWGCGVFKQDPRYVAECFIKELKQPHNFSNVYFALPDEKMYKAFSDVYYSIF